MQVRLTPQEEAQLAQAASSAGTDAEHLLKEAVLRLIGRNSVIESSSGSVVAAMRALRARVKPDPDGWTARDYVHFGRR